MVGACYVPAAKALCVSSAGRSAAAAYALCGVAPACLHAVEGGATHARAGGSRRVRREGGWCSCCCCPALSSIWWAVCCSQHRREAMRRAESNSLITLLITSLTAAAVRACAAITAGSSWWYYCTLMSPLRQCSCCSTAISDQRSTWGCARWGVVAVLQLLLLLWLWGGSFSRGRRTR
jgi:hypothetical protein